MRKTLLRFLFFLVLLKFVDILISAAFEWSLQTIRQADHDYGSFNRMYNGKINADIIFFGSSRTYLHINPEIIQHEMELTAWNLALDGTNVEQHKFTLEEYLLHNSLPEIIVFEADMTSLDENSLRFATEYFFPYINYSEHTRNLFAKTWEEKIYYQFFSSSSYKQQIPVVISNYKSIFSNLLTDNLAFTNLSPDTVIKEDMGEYILVNGAMLFKGQIPEELPDSLPLLSPQDTGSISKTRLREFEELAQYSEEKGFILVLVSPPWLSGSIENARHQTISNLYMQIDNKYNNTYYVDFTYDEHLSNDLSFWMNEDHLNISGANLFSEELSKCLLDILSARKQK